MKDPFLNLRGEGRWTGGMEGGERKEKKCKENRTHTHTNIKRKGGYISENVGGIDVIIF